MRVRMCWLMCVTMLTLASGGFEAGAYTIARTLWPRLHNRICICRNHVGGTCCRYGTVVPTKEGGRER
jgi:hypothetical protein